MKGIVSSDRQTTPKYYEVKQVYAPLKLTLDGNRINVIKRDEHVDINNLPLYMEYHRERQDKEERRAERLHVAST